MDYTVRRVCPFCGRVIVLNQCSIYATNQRRAVAEQPLRSERVASAATSPAGRPAGMSALDEFDSEMDAPPAEPSPPRPITPRAASETGAELLWCWRPPRQAEATRRGRWFSAAAAGVGEPPLVPLTAFPPERLARRFCSNPQCNEPLPTELDERQAHIMAIVGLNGAGKTYYLATAFSEAMNGNGLDVAGFREFEPDDETARYFYTNYYNRVYRDNRLFEPTPERGRADQRPLNFRVCVEGAQPMLVMTHDIAGETLVDHAKRAQDAGFLRRSSGLIFLVDPLEFDTVRSRVPHDELPYARSIHQRDLLSATLRELEFEPGRLPVPAAVVISKADLLTRFLPAGAGFLELGHSRARTEEAWLREMQESSTAVRSMLIGLGQERLVRTAEQYGRVSFHAVSALGSNPARNGGMQPNPLRVLDPLAVVLWRLATALR